mmetsp:Transcript_66546/g.124148  ORF Transcript_66546/g.124148 Transcript_66546/m.124148 type:complete len:255 (+) Transcript_66546:123-887(+)
MVKGNTSLRNVTDGVLHYLSVHDGSTAYLFSLLTLLTVLLAVIPVLMGMSYAEDPHVMHWHGNNLVWACYAIPVVLSLVTLAMFATMLIRPGRAKTRHTILGTFVLATTALVGLGIFISVETFRLEADLVYDCSATPRSAALEAETQRVANFKTACEVKMGRQALVTQCPEYGRHFMPGGKHEYIETLEEDFECSGFCNYRAETLYTESASQTRCADAVAADLFSAGVMTSVTLLIYGALLATTSACLLSYENI